MSNNLRYTSMDEIREIIRSGRNLSAEEEYAYSWIACFDKLRESFHRRMRKTNVIAEKAAKAIKYTNDIENRWKTRGWFSKPDADWVRLNVGWFISNSKEWRNVEFPEIRMDTRRSSVDSFDLFNF